MCCVLVVCVQGVDKETCHVPSFLWQGTEGQFYKQEKGRDGMVAACGTWSLVAADFWLSPSCQHLPTKIRGCMKPRVHS